MGNKSAGYNSVQTRLKCDRFSLKADVAPVSARFVPKADVQYFFFQVLFNTSLYYCTAIASRTPTAPKASATPKRMPITTL